MNTTRNKGFTLLEMIVYMSLFSLICVGSIYISIYVQKVYEKNTIYQTHKIATYTYLNLIQRYALKDVVIQDVDKAIEFVFDDIYISKLKLYIHPDSKELCLSSLYRDRENFKEVCIYPQTRFTKLDIVPVLKRSETVSARSLYKVYIEWEGGNVEEYMYVPKSMVL